MKTITLLKPFFLPYLKIKFNFAKFWQIIFFFLFMLSLGFLAVNLVYYLFQYLALEKHQNQVRQLEKENAFLEVELTRRLSAEKIQEFIEKETFVKAGGVKFITLFGEMAGPVSGLNPGRTSKK